MPDHHTLSTDDFARAVGIAPDAVPPATADLLRANDLRYRRLAQEERDRVILGILARLDADGFARAGQERHGIWELAWADRADSFKAANYDVAQLIPNYMDANPIVRWNGDYAQPERPGFEHGFSDVLRTWLFNTYLQPAPSVYEFGCGSGFNLALLGRLCPDKRLYGLDWAMSAVDLVNEIGRSQGLRLQGRRFDFFDPDPELRLDRDSAVITLCALEQVGSRHRAFVQYLIDQAPLVCVHMEPLGELYDTGQLPDYLAARYHRQRNYLDRFLTHLQELETQGRISIIKTQRVRFGNLYHEGYSFVVWTPQRG